MDFSIDDTTTELTGLVREMGEQLVTDESLRELDARFGPGAESGGTDRATARFHDRFWDELVRAGVPAALAPEPLGGAGLGVVADVLVLRELGRVLAPVPLSATLRAARLLDAAALGPSGWESTGLGGPAGERTAESDRPAAVAAGRQLAAVSDGPAAEVDWAPVADIVLRADAEGLRVAERAALTIRRTVPVDFSCAGLVEGDLGEPTPLPEGAAELDALTRRVHLAAYQWGVTEAALERTAAYAGTRHQFGRPIGTFQAVAARLADGSIDVDAVRLSTLRAAYELDACGGIPGAAARAAVGAAHFWACDAGHRLAHSAVHIHGGVGLDRSEPAHRYFLAAKAAEFRLGGATRQLIDLGDVLAAAGDPWEHSA